MRKWHFASKLTAFQGWYITGADSNWRKVVPSKTDEGLQEVILGLLEDCNPNKIEAAKLLAKNFTKSDLILLVNSLLDIYGDVYLEEARPHGHIGGAIDATAELLSSVKEAASEGDVAFFIDLSNDSVKGMSKVPKVVMTEVLGFSESLAALIKKATSNEDEVK